MCSNFYAVTGSILGSSSCYTGSLYATTSAVHLGNRDAYRQMQTRELAGRSLHLIAAYATDWCKCTNKNVAASHLPMQLLPAGKAAAALQAYTDAVACAQHTVASRV